MARIVMLASGFAVANAGACTSDDQSLLKDPQVVGESQDKCGKKCLSLTGIDHDCFASCVEADLGISSACTECYFSVAEYGFKNCKAACLLGWCKSGCLSCTQPGQDALPACTGFAPSVADPCDTVPASGLAANGGACTSDDQTLLKDPQVVGESQDKCGKKCLSLSGIDHDCFASCVEADLGISSACTECYFSVAEYGFKNCKAACLLGWCKSGCLSCTQPGQDALPACTGFAPSVAEPCDTVPASGLAAKGGACTSDDQTLLKDPQVVGESQDKCGKKCLSLSGIDHDCFASCVEADLGISSACTECYFSVAEYGFKNCKAACLLGWCKSGCLSCTQPGQDALPACTGFAPSVAEPCDNQVV